MALFHLEMRQFPHVARVFNLSREELDARFASPWVNGIIIEHEDRRWAPERARLTIYEGPSLRADEMGLGRGWSNVTKSSQEVTETVLQDAQRGAQASSAVQAFKESLRTTAPTPVTFVEVVALAGRQYPHWRASQILALAEQAVWEMLHQGTLVLTRDGSPVPESDWEPIVLSWSTWSAAGANPLLLAAP
jgi:hypothetical protein